MYGCSRALLKERRCFMEDLRVQSLVPHISKVVRKSSLGKSPLPPEEFFLVVYVDVAFNCFNIKDKKGKIWTRCQPDDYTPAPKENKTSA